MTSLWSFLQWQSLSTSSPVLWLLGDSNQPLTLDNAPDFFLKVTNAILLTFGIFEEFPWIYICQTIHWVLLVVEMHVAWHIDESQKCDFSLNDETGEYLQFLDKAQYCKGFRCQLIFKCHIYHFSKCFNFGQTWVDCLLTVVNVRSKLKIRIPFVKRRNPTKGTKDKP